MDMESYDDGYKTGRNWKRSNIPGGPFACDDESRKSRAVWLEGFYDGLEVNRYKKTENIKALMGRLTPH